jgi:hypothetical protein
MSSFATDAPAAGEDLDHTEGPPKNNSSIFYKYEDIGAEEERFIALLSAVDTKEKLIDMFKQYTVHPRLPRARLLQCAKAKKEAVKESGLWDAGVAKQFGQALKASRANEQKAGKYIEAFHPEWARWRCAVITEGTIGDEEVIAQFFDTEKTYVIKAEKLKKLPFMSIPMLQAAESCNIPRLVSLLQTDRKSVHIIRTGCSLLISLTVGRHERSVELNQTDCVALFCSLIEERKHNSDDGDTMESLLRVLLNLACTEENIPRIDEHSGIDLIVSAMRLFPSHSGVQYAGAKTLHNIALENRAISSRINSLGAIEIITTAMERFSRYDNLQEWAEKSISVIREFASQPEYSDCSTNSDSDSSHDTDGPLD